MASTILKRLIYVPKPFLGFDLQRDVRGTGSWTQTRAAGVGVFQASEICFAQNQGWVKDGVKDGNLSALPISPPTAAFLMMTER